MIEQITHNKQLLSIIVRDSYRKEGISFFTPDDLSQQLAFMQHPEGKIIQPHVHNPVPREVHYTQEVLFIRKGKLRVDFYSAEQEYLESRILGTGDVILLIEGGHGFEVLEALEMFEVKQGPYMGEADKTRFDGKDGKRQRSEVRGQKRQRAEGRRKKTEDDPQITQITRIRRKGKGWMSDVGGRKTEDRGLKTGDRGDRRQRRQGL